MASFARRLHHVVRLLPAAACATATVAAPATRCEEEEGKPRITCFGEAMVRYIPDLDADKQLAKASPNASRWLRAAGGAELNITVALARLGWGGRARWVSVLPEGVLGDDFMQLLGSAYPDGKGKDNLRLVRREEGDIGIYHVWPAEHKIWFQRHRSVFGLMDPGWFSKTFWRELLAPTGEVPGASPHVLHVTGITPSISVNTHAAWSNALETAHALKEEGKAGKLLVTMDLNHRPALCRWQELWRKVEPHIGALDVLVFSIGDVINVGKEFGEPFAEKFKDHREKVPPGFQGARDLDALVRFCIGKLQHYLGNRTNICVTCKVRADPPGSPPHQLRWSICCLKDGTVISTFDTAVEQRVREEIGGGDSWLSGLIDGLAGSPERGAAAPNWSQDMWRLAMQRGDMLACLKQNVVGDFSTVERHELEAALKAHHKKP